eukprot:6490434-Amphidinium_carterae.3
MVFEAFPPKMDTKWQGKHQQYIDKKQLGNALREYRWSSDHHLLGITTSRERDMLDVIWAHATAENAGAAKETLAAALYVNVSQTIEFEPYTLYKVHALTKSSKIYSYMLDTVLDPHMHFELLGWPCVPDLSSLSRAQAYDLTAEAMSVPCSTSLAVSALAVIRGLTK